MRDSIGDSASVAIIGAGSAGLMAAQILAKAGCAVVVYDRMPSPARKFLMAGRGGLNLTHSEPLEKFLTRYGDAAEWLAPHIQNFPPQALRDWCSKLGVETFIGSSGRVFPKELKASPLLRAWLRYLDQLGVVFRFNMTWRGWDADGALMFGDANGAMERVKPSATLLALGGASWPRLGSDGGWVLVLRDAGVVVNPLRPANCGFVVGWSDVFRQRCAGQPLKPLRAIFAGHEVRGEVMITEAGIEGGIIYALSSPLREVIAEQGAATLHLDLRPDLSCEDLIKRLSVPQGRQTFSAFLRKAAGLSPVALSLVQEILHGERRDASTPEALAAMIKALPLKLTAPFPMSRAISSAGGICRDAVDKGFMLRQKSGVFIAGEMLDWEAPTGGYLLQATFSTAVAAAQGILGWIKR